MPGEEGFGGAAPVPAVRVVAAGGVLDFTTAEALEQSIVSGLDAGAVHVVVDFSCTRFLDSSGINALLRANRSVSAVNGWVRLSGVSEPVLATMRIVGLDEVLPVYATVDLALQA